MASKTLKRALPVALLAATGTAFAVAPQAEAAFTSPYTAQCSGTSILGRGASFQNLAQQNVFIGTFKTNNSAITNDCPRFTGTITYQGTGSGAGRAAFGEGAAERDADVRYIAFDEAPTYTPGAPVDQESQIEEAQGTTGAGVLRTVPVAQGAAAIIVNFPDGCTAPNRDSAGRIVLKNGQVERVFAHVTQTWGQLVPGISGEGCSSRRITRVVRSSGSGTTFNVKNFLEKADGTATPNYDWSEIAALNNGSSRVGLEDQDGDGTTNTEWPDQGSDLTRASSGGNLAVAVRNTDGSIGYTDLASARNNGFDQSATSDANPADLYWLGLNNPSGVRQEPSKAAATSATRGANCASTAYSSPTFVSPAAPATVNRTKGDYTLANWSRVEGTSSGATYPICLLTYVGAWDDAADVYGTSAAEQGRARTVKDLLGYATSIGTNSAQSRLAGADYAALPTTDSSQFPTAGGNTNVTSIARSGVLAIDWNK